MIKDEIIEEDINNWLNEHPEATTTVQNKSITETKISNIFLPYIKNGYVTPEMFGAVGDGVADDSGAIEQTLSSNKNIIMKALQIINLVVLALNVVINIIAGNIPAVLGWLCAILGWVAYSLNTKTNNYEKNNI